MLTQRELRAMKRVPLFTPVLPLCCYGKVLDFMIKNTKFTKNIRLQKQTYT